MKLTGNSIARLSRRGFLRVSAACATMAGAFASGCASLLPDKPEPAPPPPLECSAADDSGAFDYVVVGSGAGGGPLAGNLALAGYRVLLLEAGGDEASLEYEVPAFNARASEDPRTAWNFFVRHYGDDAKQRRDVKFRAEQNGVLYPRCATVGGCTAHSAMIVLYPHNSDWDHIAEVTGDASWQSANMRRYFERLERCEYVSPSVTASRHGFRGWLTTNVADPLLMLRDLALQSLVGAALAEALHTLGRPFTRVLERLATQMDPNDWRLVTARGEGICRTPFSVSAGHRVGTREYIHRVASACPGNLVVRTHALATRVLLDDSQRATGVEYMAGPSLYAADPRSRPDGPTPTAVALARREVIVCAGAFNTPQLLKLSGIGPRAELERLGIPVRVELDGVGENLQDRYEVCVVTRMKHGFALMQGMKLRPPAAGEEPDPPLVEWEQGRGPYATNGAVVSMIKRSSPAMPEPDLFIFGLLGRFEGYYPGYSKAVAERDDYFSWAILKAHTGNTAGRVTLRSGDPRATPDINFHYFEEGNGPADDLDAVVEGIETVRRIVDRCSDVVAEEVLPGKIVSGREQLRAFVESNAWGHHACGTCRMGPANDRGAVVDNRFRVHRTRGLRVVDASVFPKIPGFFIATAIYMISEKASDDILAAARADGAPRSAASAAGAHTA